MKRLTAVLSIFLTFALLTALPAEAQHQQYQQHHGQQGQQGQQGMMARPDSMPGGMMGMMQGMRGMHQQMMQNPMHRAQMMTFMLPALADTLGLSDQQIEQMNQLKSEAMAQQKEHQEQMMARRKQMMGLFEGEDQPAPADVRQHLTAMAEMRANRQASMYDTAQSMREVLTAEQREMLSGMPMQQRMRQMMANMPMMDMMQMMRSMRGNRMGGMMQGDMENMPMQRHRQNR